MREIDRRSGIDLKADPATTRSEQVHARTPNA